MLVIQTTVLKMGGGGVLVTALLPEIVGKRETTMLQFTPSMM